jgi:hypothetical protein
MDKRDTIQAHFDKLSHVLNELITTKGKMSNIEEATTFLGSMPKYTRISYWPNQVKWVLFIRH